MPITQALPSAEVVLRTPVTKDPCLLSHGTSLNMRSFFIDDGPTSYYTVYTVFTLTRTDCVMCLLFRLRLS